MGSALPFFLSLGPQSTQPCKGGLSPSALHVLAVYERGLKYPRIGTGEIQLEIQSQRYESREDTA